MGNGHVSQLRLTMEMQWTTYSARMVAEIPQTLRTFPQALTNNTKSALSQWPDGDPKDPLKGSKSEVPEHIRMTLNERNLYRYFLYNKKKYPAAPCFVPKSSGNNVPEILKAVDKLEQSGLVRVERCTNHYTGWVMKWPLKK